MRELVLGDVLTKEDTTAIVYILNQAIFRESWKGEDKDAEETEK